ncbi:MAG: NADH:flavin oxidoreductase [Bacillota bacterium]
MTKPGLFDAIRINQLNLKNRIVLPPLASKKATADGKVTQALLDYYQGRGANGLIIVEHSYIDKRGKAGDNQLALAGKDKLSGLSELADLIKKEGSAAGIQLAHAGAKAVVDQPYSPSGIYPPGIERTGNLVEMGQAQIDELVERFSAAARLAKDAGFDLIEIHAAHGYLLNQFISPLTNQRDDKYGGSPKNRFRIIKEIITAVRSEVGNEFPLALRLGADDFHAEGLRPEKAAQGLEPLVEMIDLLDLSGGLQGYDVLDKGQEGFTIYLADVFKTYISKQKLPPLLIAGGINDAETADELIKSQRIELVGVGRAQLKSRTWALDAKAEL